jgi:glucokinase
MTDQSKIPLAFPRKSELGNKSLTILAGDVGGTKTNFALYRATKENMESIKESTYHSADYLSFQDLLHQFLLENAASIPDRISLGVAGPVLKDKVEITNLSWTLERHDLLAQTKASEVLLINDLEATAYGLAALKEDDFITIHESSGNYQGNIAIIAPGTGLGEAGLFWDGSAHHPFPTEGGHSDFAPRTDVDIELYQYLRKKYEVVSWEKVIAGPGIYDIYQFLCEIRGREKAEWLQGLLHNQDPSAVISQMAVEERDSACIETMQLFVRYLARESSSLVLKMKATGGLFLGGGIPPKITPLLQQNNFYDNYLDSDRMQHLLKNVTIKIILSNKTALLGAAYYGAYGAPQS